jgi:predicted ATPase
LNSPPGSLILLEQPELHLHPALQQGLADFLLACAKSGRQLIVETHSDHIIARLRRRIAEDLEDSILNYVRLILAERKDGITSFRALPTDVYGALGDWPEGFFDQTARESQDILRASIKKRKHRKSS